MARRGCQFNVSLCAWTVLVLAAAAGLPACGGAQKAWSPSPHRADELPSGVEALVTLADEQVAMRPLTADHVDRALAALEAAERATGAPSNDVDWRIARACFLLTESVSGPLAAGYTDRGVTHAKRVVTTDEGRVEGHYYLALNMVKVVEASADVEQLGPMMEVAKRAVEIAPGFDEAGPLRLVGKVYMAAPEWPTSVGDRDEAVEMLKKAVSLAPTPLNRLFLGQAYYYVDDFDRATPHIRRALKDGAKRTAGANTTRLESRWLDEARDYLRRMGASE